MNVFVELTGDPVAVAVGAALDAGREMSEAERASLRSPLRIVQNHLATRLRSVGASIKATYTDVLNGFRIQVPRAKLAQIAAMPGVSRVSPVIMHFRDNTNTDRYTGAAKTWGVTGYTGEGVRIAVIDSGINYYHRGFAGPRGYGADDGLDRTDGNFPTAKVVDGYDFVGDAYNPSDDDTANDIPQPDNDPLDCKDPLSPNLQHGSHVAGTAAGFGVRDNGQTYQGPYSKEALDSVDWRVGPGTAPDALLMAYRVFGCDGGTLLVVDAIEKATRDGTDIINMSLGSNMGNPNSADALAVDNASRAGVTVVMSAGNDGPSAYNVGTPGIATYGIAVAAMDATINEAADLDNASYKHTAPFTSGGPRRFDAMVKPDVAAPGVGTFSVDGSTTKNGKALSGTSMASPATAGIAALIQQAHPRWTSRQIKAAIIGSATPNKLVPYEVRLSGSGLVNPKRGDPDKHAGLHHRRLVLTDLRRGADWLRATGCAGIPGNADHGPQQRRQLGGHL